MTATLQNGPVSLLDMLKVDGEKFTRLMRSLSVVEGMFATFVVHQDVNMSAPIGPDHEIKPFLVVVDPLIEELKAIGLTYSVRAALRLRDSFATPPVTLGKIQTELKSLADRIHDEFDEVLLLAVDKPTKKYYEDPQLFGKDVFTNLPSANQEMTEAGTCLAVGRATACVFHLSRALECALGVLAKDLGIPSQSNWGRSLQAIEDALQARMKASGSRTSQEQFYAESQTTFDSIRRSWRNATMHVDQTYTVERAEEILISVGSFMRHLATRLHE